MPLPRMIPDPHSVLATISFDGLSLPTHTKLQQYRSVTFLSNFQNVKPPCTKPPHIHSFPPTDLDPHLVGFLPRRIEESATATWVYTDDPTLPKPSSKENEMCETPHRLGYSYQTSKNKSNWKVLLFGFHDTNTKPKSASLPKLFETPSDSQVSWTKE